VKAAHVIGLNAARIVRRGGRWLSWQAVQPLTRRQLLVVVAAAVVAVLSIGISYAALRPQYHARPTSLQHGGAAALGASHGVPAALACGSRGVRAPLTCAHCGTPAGPKAATPDAICSSGVRAGLVEIIVTLSSQDAQERGTGMVLTPSGEVLTNTHVVAGARTIRVVDAGNGITYWAKLVGEDRLHDVAVLKLTGASHLPTVPLGDSDRATRGTPVSALGFSGNIGGPPLETRGTITGLGRSVVARGSTGEREQLSGLIESSVQLRPGDSGGPLVDSAGKVIGMNTAAVLRAPSALVRGYAIPIATALAVAERMATTHTP
jgi:S1-C subfamily serine protease